MKGGCEESNKFPTAGTLQNSPKTEGKTMIFLAATDCNLEAIQAHFSEQLMTPSRKPSAACLKLNVKCRQRPFKGLIIVFSAACVRL